ncbi:MAG: hypothetical protein ABW090_05660 [Sedimenticola sp.]
MLDASGIIHVEDNLFLVAEDELDSLRFFELDVINRSFTSTGDEIVFGAGESDFESLAYDASTESFFCIGSHGEDYSQRLVRFQLQDNKMVGLAEINFDAEQLLDEPVNIEGLSVWNGQLLVGYRSPNRSKRAVAVIYNLESQAQTMTSFNLERRTIRDMVRVDRQDYLILAGPERGKDYEKYAPRIYWWNGDIFYPELQVCHVELKDFRAEGIAIRKHVNGAIDLLVGSDESKTKAADRFRLLYLQADNIQSLINDKHAMDELEVVF